MLRVIAAAVLDADGLLLVSKRAAPGVYYLPGGKPEPHEAPLDCLHREIGEELGVEVARAEPFAEVRAPAALEGDEMWMSVFVATLTGVPRASAEIASLKWWPRDHGLGLAPAARDCVIPRLQREGRL
jgi:8-oxo-dGTP diphosphatase